MRSIAILIAIAAIAAPARAQDEPPPESNRNQWRLAVGLPDSKDLQDGRHIQITWKRYDRTRPVKVAIFRRPVHDETWWDARHGWRKPEPEPHVGAGPADAEGKAQFGDNFVNGILALEDLGKPIEIIDRAVSIENHTFAVGDPVGQWTLVALAEDKEDATFVDEVSPDGRWLYALVPFTPGADDGVIAGFPEAGVQSWPAETQSSWFNTSRWFFLAFVLGTALAFLGYMQLAKTRAKKMFIRRIPGVDAIEDAIGRSTEMGRPVLYVTGTDDLINIQTMASLLILGHVAQMTAEYDTEIKVANLYPLTMVVAEEIVRQGYSNAGRIDAHRPENVMFISSEQFAYAAAINGMILRDKPATNIFFGRFFAESLLLSESGFVVGAVQIAGTAEFTQLPFFIAACDYTLIGEELYATSAYLTREPNLMAQLKAGDVMKMAIMILIVVGVLLATFGGTDLGARLLP